MRPRPFVALFLSVEAHRRDCTPIRSVHFSALFSAIVHDLVSTCVVLTPAWVVKPHLALALALVSPIALYKRGALLSVDIWIHICVAGIVDILYISCESVRRECKDGRKGLE